MVSQNFVETLKTSMQNNQTLNALSNYHGKTYTYEEVAQQIFRFHEFFQRLNLHKGDHFALIGGNSAEWGIAYIATVTYGAVIVPILPDFTPEDIQHIINHSDSRILFSDKTIYETLDIDNIPHISVVFSLNNLQPIYFHHKTKEHIAEKINAEITHADPDTLFEKALNFAPVDDEDLESIVYTSGTTGFSKGVMLPHRSLMANVQFAMENIQLKPGDTICSFLPIAHAFGCAFEFLYPFSSGCHITFLGKIPAPTVILKAFSEIRPNLILSVPLVIEKIYFRNIKPKLKSTILKILMALPGSSHLLKKKLRNSLIEVFGGEFQEIIVGGAAFNPEVENFLKKIRFPFTVGYGMTECGPLISYAGWKSYMSGSTGRPVDTLEITIDSSNPQTEVGEILVRGKNVMNGYYKHPEATAETLDKDGWLHTGDLGIMDSNQNIFIRGRSKSLILGPSGQNIFPEEIEARLSSQPYIQESLVVSKNGKLLALIYPNVEKADQDKKSESDLIHIMEENRKKVNTTLPAYSQISAIEIIPEEFEKTPKKSIKRYRYTF